jgi:hypothetical protein
MPFTSLNWLPIIYVAFQSWSQDHPEAIAEKRVEFVTFDFFKEPPVAGQDVYYVCSSSNIVISCTLLTPCVRSDK